MNVKGNKTIQPISQDEFLSMDKDRKPFKDVEIGDLDFKGKTLFLRSSFAGAKFMGNVSFKDSTITFATNENFKGAKFYGERVSFENVSFEDIDNRDNYNIDFSSTQYADNSYVSFKYAKFLNNGELKFNFAKFNTAKIISFSRVEFSSAKGTNFSACNFGKVGEVSFFRAKFLGEGKVSFIKTIFSKEGILKFSYVDLESPENVQFIDTDLGMASLYRTDLRNIKFRRVNFFAPGQNGLLDDKWNEIFPKKKKDYRGKRKEDLYHIELSYTQLKQNFESNRDYSRAGDFHVGEMEMRRKQYKLFNQYISILSFYKFLSNYGQSWKRPSWLFLGGSVLFTMLNLLFIEWPHSDVWLGNNIFQWLSGFAESWISTLDIFLFGRIQGEGIYTKEIVTIFGRFLILFESIFGPLMLALIILALRRHTKR